MKITAVVQAWEWVALVAPAMAYVMRREWRRRMVKRPGEAAIGDATWGSSDRHDSGVRKFSDG